jgi:hypothetical protein
MNNEIIIIFFGWPVTSSEIIIIFKGFFYRINKVIVTFLSNDAHLWRDTSPLGQQ